MRLEREEVEEGFKVVGVEGWRDDRWEGEGMEIERMKGKEREVRGMGREIVVKNIRVILEVVRDKGRMREEVDKGRERGVRVKVMGRVILEKKRV